MRTIKFRGLRTDGKGWVYGSFIHNNIDCECIVDIDAEQFEVLPKSVGQFTGLTDNYGVDIYENDKLQIKGYQETWETKVFFNNGGFCIDVEEQPYNVTLLGFLDDEAIVKVIGNIHES